MSSWSQILVTYRLGGQNLIERLSTPELIVGRVLRELVEERQRVDAEAVREVAGRPAGEEQLEVIVHAARDLLAFPAGRGLAIDVVEVGLAESAVVKPVITLPAIRHRAHGHRS